jgi:hypothetical protein
MSGIKSNKPTSKSGFIQGYYKLDNPEKYIGDPEKIIYRSSWEFRFCKYCDHTADVLKWSSEPVGIPYLHPLDNRMHTYYVDYYMRLKKANSYEDVFAEVKPKASLQKPLLEGQKITTKKLKHYNNALKTWLINRAKFAAAKQFAELKGSRFILVTEEFLFGK